MNRYSVKRAVWSFIYKQLDDDRPRKWWEIVVGVVILILLVYLFVK